MTALRADGNDGSLEFDWQTVTISRKGRRARKNPPLQIPLSGGMRVYLREPKAFSYGQIAVLDVGDVEPKKHESGPRVVLYEKGHVPQIERLAEAIQFALDAGESITEAAIAEHVSQGEQKLAAVRAEAEAKIDALMRKATGAIYAGHIVDYKGYRYGLGVKYPIAGATAEFESGADRSRPTLTRIGAGALLAGPVGAIAGGMFRKDKTKGYVTIVFPDGATVIVDGPAKDEKKMRAFAHQVNAIAQAEQRRTAPDTEPAPAPEAASAADQLLKLKELHKAGVLTDEQYAEKSAPLIDQI